MRWLGSRRHAAFGRPQDEIDGVPVTLIDFAMPMMVVRADSLGKDWLRDPGRPRFRHVALRAVERMRRTAGELMGMGDVSGMVVPRSPWSRPRAAVTVSRRATWCRVERTRPMLRPARSASPARPWAPGTVASEVARIAMASKPVVVAVEHPAGQLEVSLDIHRAADGIEVVSAGLVRTARLIFDGRIYVPRNAMEPGQIGDDPTVGSAGLTYRVPNRRRRQARHRFVNR